MEGNRKKRNKKQKGKSGASDANAGVAVNPDDKVLVKAVDRSGIVTQGAVANPDGKVLVEAVNELDPSGIAAQCAAANPDDKVLVEAVNELDRSGIATQGAAASPDDKVLVEAVYEVDRSGIRNELKDRGLKARIEDLEKRLEARDCKEAVLQDEVQSLQGHMGSLVTKVEELQSSLSKLAQERDEILSRSKTEAQTDEKLEEQSPSTTEASAAAEDLTLQQALMMERLVSENVELSLKVNEQSIVISQLRNGTANFCCDSTTDKEVISNEIERNNTAKPGFVGNSSNGMEIDPAGEVIEQVEEGEDERYRSRKSLQQQVGVDVKDESSSSTSELKGDDSNLKTEWKATKETREAVPLSDAPLTGAPLRMISMVARFVSGADLVKSGG